MISSPATTPSSSLSGSPSSSMSSFTPIPSTSSSNLQASFNVESPQSHSFLAEPSSPVPAPTSAPSPPTQPQFLPHSPHISKSHPSHPSSHKSLKQRRRCIQLRDLWSSVRRTLSRNTGLLLIGAAQCFFALMNVSVKILSTSSTGGAEDQVEPEETVGALQLIVVRMSITYLCCIAYMLAVKIPYPYFGPPGVRFLLAFRGFSGFFGLFGIYFSLRYLSLSDATVLTFLAPLCTAAVGALVLGEKVGWKELGAGLCSLAGVVLIARPAFLFGEHAATTDEALPTLELVEFESMNITAVASFLSSNSTVSTPASALAGDAMGVTPAERLLAVGVALIGVLGATGAYTTIRAIGTRVHPLHNLVAFSTLSVCLAAVAMIVTGEHWVLPTRLDWLALLIMIGLFGFCAQLLLTMGLQRETAGRGTMAIYVQIVYALLFERVLFKTSPGALSLLGTCIILGSAVYVAVTKEQNEKSTTGRTGEEERALEEGLLEHHDLQQVGEAEEMFTVGEEDGDEVVEMKLLALEVGGGGVDVLEYDKKWEEGDKQ